MSVVRDFCGHGLGRLFHDEPNIVHVGRPGEGIVLKPGMFFTVEPMINIGRPHVKVLSDGWTAVTRDRSLSAQFEHTVGVTDKGVEVFTFSPGGSTSHLTKPDGGTSRLQISQSGHPTSAGGGARQRMRGFHCGEFSSGKKRDSGRGLSEASPHYHGHRERLRERFREAGAEALSDYELLEMLLFRAIPQRDVKPLAKELIAKFGSFAEVVAAPHARLTEVKGLGDAAITELKIVQAAASRLSARRGEKTAGAVVVVDACSTIAAPPGLRRPRAVPRPIPRQAQPAHRRRSTADRHRRSYAGLSARSGQARA